MEMINPSWLDYGMAGVLVVVLIGVFIFFREWFRNSQKQADQNQAFMEGLIKQAAEQQREFSRLAAEQQEAHAEAWRKIISESIDAQRCMTDAIRGVNDSVAKTSIQIERHNDLIVQRLNELKGA